MKGNNSAKRNIGNLQISNGSKNKQKSKVFYTQSNDNIIHNKQNRNRNSNLSNKPYNNVKKSSNNYSKLSNSKNNKSLIVSKGEDRKISPIIRNGKLIVYNNSYEKNKSKNFRYNNITNIKNKSSIKQNMNNNPIIKYNKNNIQVVNKPQKNYIEVHPKYSNNNVESLNQKIKKIKDYQFMEFHPYTFKECKEMIRNPVVLGHLGPNIGTEEWEFKKNKMKKMLNYSNNICMELKGITKLKKYSPKDEVEKLTKEKIENSSRFKAVEYCKLVRNNLYKDDTYGENILNNNKIFNNITTIPHKSEESYQVRYKGQNEEKEDFEKTREANLNQVNKYNESMGIEEMLKQKETYAEKINNIRESLLD